MQCREYSPLVAAQPIPGISTTGNSLDMVDWRLMLRLSNNTRTSRKKKKLSAGVQLKPLSASFLVDHCHFQETTLILFSERSRCSQKNMPLSHDTKQNSPVGVCDQSSFSIDLASILFNPELIRIFQQLTCQDYHPNLDKLCARPYLH